MFFLRVNSVNTCLNTLHSLQSKRNTFLYCLLIIGPTGELAPRKALSPYLNSNIKQIYADQLISIPHEIIKNP